MGRGCAAGPTLAGRKRWCGGGAVRRSCSSQVYRLVVERPERLNLKVLMALLDILDCGMDELIEPVAASRPARRRKVAGGDSDPGLGDFRPKRARITDPR